MHTETIKGKSLKTKQFIIEKAAPIFNRKGIAGTSLSDLTRATGLTKGSIYGNFKNKDEVAVRAFQYNLDFIRGYFTREMKRANTYYEKLLAYPGVFKKMYRELLENGGCPILNTVTEADDTHPVLHQQAVEAIEFWRTGIVRLITKGRNKGEFREDAEPEKIAEIIICLLEGGTLLVKATGRETYLLNAIDQVTRIIVSIKADG